MENKLLQPIACTDKEFNDCYTKLFKDSWYPDYFIRPGYDAIFLEDATCLCDILIQQIEIFGDEKIFFRSFNYTKQPMEVCHYILRSHSSILKMDDIYDLTLCNMDFGVLIFGSSTKWALYLGEDLFYNKLLAEFNEIMFVFVKPEIKPKVFEFYKEKYGASFYTEIAPKGVYFDGESKEEYIDLILGRPWDEP